MQASKALQGFTNDLKEGQSKPMGGYLQDMVYGITANKSTMLSEIGRALGVTQKTAWLILHRIHLATQSGSFIKLGGEGKEVEVDETFISGAARFMNPKRKKRMITERGVKDKTAVVGVLERGGHVRTAVVPNRKKH